MNNLNYPLAVHPEAAWIDFKRGRNAALSLYLRSCNGRIDARLASRIANADFLIQHQGLMGGSVPPFNWRLQAQIDRRQSRLKRVGGNIGRRACHAIAKLLEGHHIGGHKFWVASKGRDLKRGNRSMVSDHERAKIARYMVTKYPPSFDSDKLYTTIPKPAIQDAKMRFGGSTDTMRRIWHCSPSAPMAPN